MKKNLLLYSFFTLLISITVIDLINSDKSFSELENRGLASQVEFSFKNYFDGSYPKKYETYMSDQFIMRDTWIDLKSRTEFLLGKLENNGIVYGKENYLFEKFTKVDEHRVTKNIESINEFVESTSIPISVMIAPNSYEIYKNNIPSLAPLVKQQQEIGDIYNKLQKTNNINLIKIFESTNENTYYKTDHHWTSFGSYLAYVEYVKSINLEPIELSNLKEVVVPNFFGTFYSKAKPFNGVSDNLVYYDIDNIKLQIDDKEYNTLYDLDKLETRDKYSVFLYGNNPLTVVKNTKLNNNKKLLVFKDSYANCMVPFLTSNFEEIHVIDLRSFGPKVSEYLKENDFDEILILYNYINFNRDSNLIKLKY